jgi:hypothetical protein
MAKVDFNDDDPATDINMNEEVNELHSSGKSTLEVRRKIEDMLEERRLRKELQDFYYD